MTELLKPQETERIQTQFAELGHVGVAGVYSAELASKASREIPTLYSTPHNPLTAHVANSSRGNQKPTNFKPHFRELVEATTVQANHLRANHVCWPSDASYFLQTIGMGPNVEGIEHRDADGHPGAVSVGNFSGSSRLLIEDGSEYQILPGDVVYLDPDRRLIHQGIAGVDGRFGLVIAITNPPQERFAT